MGKVADLTVIQRIGISLLIPALTAILLIGGWNVVVASTSETVKEHTPRIVALEIAKGQVEVKIPEIEGHIRDIKDVLKEQKIDMRRNTDLIIAEIKKNGNH